MPTYCLIPPELAHELQNVLSRHFGDDPSTSVVIDRRRKANGGRPADSAGDGNGHGLAPTTGPHMGDRRAVVIETEGPALPRRARRHAARLRFVQRVPASERQVEDAEATRLVIQAQRGDTDAFAELYGRYFDRVHAYLRMALRDRDEAEDLAQQVFLKALRRLDTYEVGPHRSFRPWLFRIADNQLIDHLRKHRPTLLEDPERITDEAGTRAADVETVQSTLSWMSESEVAICMRRLPMAQRQVVTLRYVIGLSLDETADALNRSPGSIRQLDYRARQYLQGRLTALGRRPVVVRRRGLRTLRQQMHVLRERRFVLWRR
jgi:RNA polymerase sigma-70 factor (ECF subfamily)